MKSGKVGKWSWRLSVIVLFFLAAGPMLADQGDPPARVARISYVSGKVSLEPAGVNQWSEASLNYPMTNNDRLYTDQGSRAELEVGSAAVRLSEATDLTVANLTDQFMQLGLAQGTLRLSIYELPSGNSVEVDTPNGALTLTQQGQYRVDSYPNDNATLVSVYNGALQLSGGGLSQTVQSGQAVKLTGTGPIGVTYVTLPAEDSFDQWSAARDLQFTAASPRYVSPETPGYEALNGYGVWSEEPAYGPIWYPSAVPAGWAPYRYGHWVWVGPWGWTWVDTEPWGFAPFHYGRWAYVGSRWGWLPGPVVARPYYAPALVAFVGGAGFSVGFGFGGAGLAAWFPLGPREPFYPWYHCGGGYLREVNVTNVRNVTNINTFVNARNAGNVRYVNERVATTAVRANVFSSGAPVRNGMVRLSAAQISRAQVIPHPSINPARGAALGGRLVAAPVRTQRFTTVQARQRLASVRPIQRPTSPRANQRLAPTTSSNRSYQPPRAQATRSYAPSERQAAGNYPPTTRPQLIMRNTPPPGSVPFSTKLRAMQSHPGRPLEPQQVNNLRAGRPAGAMRDKEYIPHPGSSSRQQRSAPAQSRGASQGKRH